MPSPIGGPLEPSLYL